MWRALGQPGAECRAAEPCSDHHDIDGVKPGHLVTLRSTAESDRKTMTAALLELYRHKTWATLRLIDQAARSRPPTAGVFRERWRWPSDPSRGRPPQSRAVDPRRARPGDSRAQ